MKHYIPVEIQVVDKSVDVITSSAIVRNDTGIDTPMASMAPGAPSYAYPGMN